MGCGTTTPCVQPSQRRYVGYHQDCCSNLQVSCMVPNVGAAGGNQFHSGLCILTQVFLSHLFCFIKMPFFRTSSTRKSTWCSGSGTPSLSPSPSSSASTASSPSSATQSASTCSTKRWKLEIKACNSIMFSQICHKWDKDIRKCLHFVLAKCQVGQIKIRNGKCKMPD